MSALWNKLMEIFSDAFAVMVHGKMEETFELLSSLITSKSDQIQQVPSTFDPDIFSKIEGVTDNVILPIGLGILAIILAYELIDMFVEKNNMHDFETFLFFKWVVKAITGIMLVQNAFNIANSIFLFGADIASKAGMDFTVEFTSTAPSVDVFIKIGRQDFGLWKLFQLLFQIVVIYFAMVAIRAITYLIILTRILKMFVYASAAPIPLATFTSGPFSQTSHNYLKGLIALAISGLFMLIIMGIYANLMGDQMASLASALQETSLSDEGNPIIMVFIYSFLMLMMLKKSDEIANSVIGAH